MTANDSFEIRAASPRFDRLHPVSPAKPEMETEAGKHQPFALRAACFGCMAELWTGARISRYCGPSVGGENRVDSA